MDLQLSNIVEHTGKNELSIAYSAYVIVNGVRAGIAINDGKGEDTVVKGIDPTGQWLINKAELFYKKPAKSITGKEAQGPPLTLTHHVDDLAMKTLLNDKNTAIGKKIADAVIDSIAYGRPGGKLKKYRHKKPITELLKTTLGIESIKTILAKIKEELQPGEMIFNNNLPEELLKGLPTTVSLKFKKDHSLKPPGETRKGNRK